MESSPLLLSLLSAKKSAPVSVPVTLTHLQEAHSLLMSHPSAVSFITRPVLEMLSRLSKLTNYHIVKHTARLYTLISKLVPRTDVTLQITLSNDILLLADQYRGTTVAYELSSLALQLLVELLKSAQISDDQRSAIQTLVNKKPKSDLEFLLSQVDIDLKAGRITGISRLMELFSSNTSLREQLDLFGTKATAVFSSLQGQNDPDMMKKLHQFLDQIVFQVYFRVNLPHENRIFMNSDAQLLSNNENCFYTTLLGLKLLVKGGFAVSVVKFIRRLWVLYPNLRRNLYEIAGNCMKVMVNEHSSETNNSAAASFLYFVRHNPEVEFEFKEEIDGISGVEELTKSRMYDSSALNQYPETETATDLGNLQVFSGYPVASHIPAGERFSHVVDIDEPGSILVWGFATEAGDITYAVYRSGDGEEVEVKREERVQADTTPVLGNLLVTEPGFVRFIWDNSYSWFREKHLRYRITVLRPLASSIDSVPTLKKPPIELLFRDSVNEPSGDNTCYADPSADILEIGVHIGDTVTEIRCGEVVRSVETAGWSEHLDGVVFEAVAGLESKPKYVKLGIVEKTPMEKPGLETFGTVAIARDAEALAYFSQKTMKTAHTILAVVSEDGVRSAVMHRGKLLLSESGQTLGDLSRMRVASLSDGIAVLLSIFGPAVVIVTGRDFAQTIAALAEEVRLKVPLDIWQHSVLRESILGKSVLLEAAVKLNALHHHFKHTF